MRRLTGKDARDSVTIICIGLLVGMMVGKCNAATLPDEYKVGKVVMPMLYDSPTCRVFQDCWVDLRGNLAERIEYNNKMPVPQITQQIAWLQEIVDQNMTALRLAAYATTPVTVAWVRVTTKDGVVHRVRTRLENDPASPDPVRIKKKPTYMVVLLPEKYQQQRLLSLTLEGGE